MSTEREFECTDCTLSMIITACTVDTQYPFKRYIVPLIHNYSLHSSIQLHIHGILPSRTSLSFTFITILLKEIINCYIA